MKSENKNHSQKNNLWKIPKTQSQKNIAYPNVHPNFKFKMWLSELGW